MPNLRAALAATVLLASVLPAFAALRITFDGGGRLGEYIERYNRIRQEGTKIEIDGMCISACTMITGLIDDENVCVTPRARLAFHSAHDMQGEHSSEGTRLMWSIFPERVRALLISKGFDGNDPEKNEHPNLIYIEGAELLTIYRAC